MRNERSRQKSVEARLVREGEYWSIEFAGTKLRVRDSKGVRHLSCLLSQPGQEIPALALASARSPAGNTQHQVRELPVNRDSELGSTLDARAKRVFRDRLDDLSGEIEQAGRFNDPERLHRARTEQEAIVSELRAATGLGGRDRRIGSIEERARLNTTRAIRSAIARTAEHSPWLADHLAACVQTGRVCVYLPGKPALVRWEVHSRTSPSARRFPGARADRAGHGRPTVRYRQAG